jgi:hypothetical protein
MSVKQSSLISIDNKQRRSNLAADRWRSRQLIHSCQPTGLVVAGLVAVLAACLLILKLPDASFGLRVTHDLAESSANGQPAITRGITLVEDRAKRR